jgi:hypothetical protein
MNSEDDFAVSGRNVKIFQLGCRREVITASIHIPRANNCDDSLILEVEIL